MKQRTILASRKPIRDEAIPITGDRTYQRDFVPIIIDGRQFGRLWLYDDITNQRRAEKALRESEQRLRNYFELGLIGMAKLSTDRHFLHYNNRLCEILGYNQEELAQQSWDELTHPDDLAKDQSRFARIERQETDIFHMEKRFLSKEGKIVHTEVIARGVCTDKGHVDHYVAMFQDITTRKHTEEKTKTLRTQLLQSQKLEAIGTLAGGIAHDFNNILAAVIGYTDMAKEMTEPGTPLARDLDQVLKAGHRAKDLVRQILVFSRQNETEPINLMPANIIKEVIKLLRPTLPSTIEIKQKISPKAGPIHMDPTQLHQILMNICTNAFHAMEKTGGRLRLALKGCTLTEADLRSQPQVQPGTFIRLTVADTGPGVPPLLLDKIFDPYFTTKETGRGTGMGLAIVHGIVTTIGGFITYDGIPGKGAIFHIYLPAVDGTSLAAQPVTISNIQGSGNILLVDDEEMLVEMGEEMLQMLGYNVTTCTNSRNALGIFQGTPEKFSAVITDQTMPEMTGSVLAQKILEIRPDLPIILCTGYSHIIDKTQAKSLGIQGFLMKPYSQQKLGALLKQVLTKEVNGPH